MIYKSWLFHDMMLVTVSLPWGHVQKSWVMNHDFGILLEKNDINNPRPVPVIRDVSAAYYTSYIWDIISYIGVINRLLSEMHIQVTNNNHLLMI